MERSPSRRIPMQCPPASIRCSSRRGRPYADYVRAPCWPTLSAFARTRRPFARRALGPRHGCCSSIEAQMVTPARAVIAGPAKDPGRAKPSEELGRRPMRPPAWERLIRPAWQRAFPSMPSIVRSRVSRPPAPRWRRRRGPLSAVQQHDGAVCIRVIQTGRWPVCYHGNTLSSTPRRAHGFTTGTQRA
jgi:hypothetical protein